MRLRYYDDGVVAGLAAGDTGPNTKRAYRELIEQMRKRQQDYREQHSPHNEVLGEERAGSHLVGTLLQQDSLFGLYLAQKRPRFVH